MAKPGTTLEWNDGVTNHTEPLAGQKATGWTLNQVPPSSYFNWWMHLTGLWIQWLAEQIENARWVDVTPRGYANTNLTVNISGYVTPTAGSPTPAGFSIGLHIPDGVKIDGLRVRVYGDGVVGTTDMPVSIARYEDGVRTIIGPATGAFIPDAMLAPSGVVPAAWTTYSTTFTPHTVDHTNGAFYEAQLLLINQTTNFRIQSVGYRLADPT